MAPRWEVIGQYRVFGRLIVSKTNRLIISHAIIVICVEYDYLQLGLILSILRSFVIIRVCLTLNPFPAIRPLFHRHLQIIIRRTPHTSYTPSLTISINKFPNNLAMYVNIAILMGTIWSAKRR